MPAFNEGSQNDGTVQKVAEEIQRQESNAIAGNNLTDLNNQASSEFSVTSNVRHDHEIRSKTPLDENKSANSQIIAFFQPDEAVVLNNRTPANNLEVTSLQTCGNDKTGRNEQLPATNMWIENDLIPLQENSVIKKLFWCLQPIFTLYFYVKHSDGRIASTLSILKNIFFRFVSFLQSKNKYIQGARELDVPDSSAFDSTFDYLYKKWLQFYQNLRHAVDLIEELYEKIVPLIPGEENPLSTLNKDSLTIRDLCFNATICMLSRIPYHMKNYFRNAFTFDVLRLLRR